MEEREGEGELVKSEELYERLHCKKFNFVTSTKSKKVRIDGLRRHVKSHHAGKNYCHCRRTDSFGRCKSCFDLRYRTTTLLMEDFCAFCGDEFPSKQSLATHSSRWCKEGPSKIMYEYTG